MDELSRQANCEDPDAGELGPGITKTDFFAAMAMHGLLLADKGISTDRLVIDAFRIAQAMSARSEGAGKPIPS